MQGTSRRPSTCAAASCSAPTSGCSAEADAPQASVAIEPIDYLERSGIPTESARRFVEQYSATADELRSLYAAEIESYGPSAWRSSTFDRKPLLRLKNGGVLPTSFQALERLGYEGTYWALRSRPEEDNAFTSRYGLVVEEFVKTALTRVAGLDDRRPTLSGDFLYGPRKERARSSDVNLRYGPDWFAFEVVTGRPGVATVTRGDMDHFQNDVARLVVKKAKQLARCQLDAILYGRLKLSDFPNRPERYWPIIVFGDGFPMMPPLYGVLQQMVSAEVRFYVGQPTLTFMDADDLAAFERLAELGHKPLEVFRNWKRERGSAPLASWVFAQPSLRAMGMAQHHQAVFDRLTTPWAEEMQRLADEDT